MMKIAIVEDEKDLNNLIRAYLEKEGYDVISFYDGKDALSALDKDINLWK